MKKNKIELRMGLIETLTLILIVLKLFGLISWSWWLVLSPVFICLGIIILLVTVMTIMLFIINTLEKQLDKIR